MIKLAKGTSEFINVDITDTLGALDNLAGANVKYDVIDHAGVTKISQATAITNGMRAQCLIDTATTPSNWPEGKYRLFVNFNNAPEAPRVGPFYFKVTDD